VLLFRNHVYTMHRLLAHLVCLFLARQPHVGQGIHIHEVPRSHTTTRHRRYDSSWREISPSQRPLPDHTQHSQQTNVHAPGGFWAHNLNRRAAADPRLRPRGHWDRLCTSYRTHLTSCRFIAELLGVKADIHRNVGTKEYNSECLL